MREDAERFMDLWLDQNVRPTHLNQREALVAKVLARRCIADAEMAGINVDVLEEVVVDIEEAIADELKLMATQPVNDLSQAASEAAVLAKSRPATR
jgi:hypothetical protein